MSENKKEFAERLKWAMHETEVILFLLSSSIIISLIWFQEITISVIDDLYWDGEIYFWYRESFLRFYIFVMVLFSLWGIVIFYYITLEILRVLLKIKSKKLRLENKNG